MPQAAGDASAHPDLFELHPCMHMDRMQLIDAVNRRIKLLYGRGKYLLEEAALPLNPPLHALSCRSRHGSS
jgi:hypothetical protein